MIQKAEKRDVNTVASLAVLMWDNHSATELASEFSEIMSQENARFFLKYEGDIL